MRSAVAIRQIDLLDIGLRKGLHELRHHRALLETHQHPGQQHGAQHRAAVPTGAALDMVRAGQLAILGGLLAREAMERMKPLFAIEAEIHGQPPEARLAVRLTRSAQVMADLRAWLEATARRISGKSDQVKAIRKRWRRGPR